MMMMMVKLLMFLSFGGLSMCEVFLVGDEEGWNSGINFATWSQNHNFTKGDFLGIHQLFSLSSIRVAFSSCESV